MNVRSILLMVVATLMAIGTASSQAQTIPELESHLAKSFDRIAEYYRLSREERTVPGKTEDYIDSLDRASEALRQWLLATLPKISGSVSENVNVPESMWVVTSDDKKLRGWAWDTKTGGSMPEIVMLVEYQTPHGLAVIDARDTDRDGGNPDWFDTVYTVHSTSGHTYYLPVLSSQYSTSAVGSRIEAFEIVGDKLQRAKLFRTPKRDLSSIGINYDYFSNYSDALGRERYRIKLTPDHHVLTIPVVIGDKVTSRSLRYEFDGERFVFKPAEK